MHYFNGSWEEALAEFNRVQDDINLGQEPLPEEPCVKDLLHAFLTNKKEILQSKEIKEITFRDCQITCRSIRDFFGYPRKLSSIRATDFTAFRAELAKTRSLHTLANIIGRCRSVFKYGIETDLVSSIKGLGSFKKPKSKKVNADRKRRNQEQGRGGQTFSREEVLALLDNANPTMKAMILLGINCALGNEDCCQLKQHNILGDHLDYPETEDRGGQRVVLVARDTPSTSGCWFTTEDRQGCSTG